MTLLLTVVLVLSGLMVAAEGLNKLERTQSLMQPGLSVRERASLVLRIAAWFALVLAGFGAMATPFLHHQEPPDLRYALSMLGVAMLVIRSRMRHQHGHMPPDEFERSPLRRS